MQCIYALGHTCLENGGVAGFNVMSEDLRKAGAFEVRSFQNFAEVRAAGAATYLDSSGAATITPTTRFTLTELGWLRFQTVRGMGLQAVIDLTVAREHANSA